MKPTPTTDEITITRRAAREAVAALVEQMKGATEEGDWMYVHLLAIYVRDIAGKL
jgi:hypothetical protein